jgi:S1-C subfamily serine protease
MGRAMGRTVQIAAFVNYGNLGGPAIGPDGKVVGITGHLRPGSMWGQNSGVGFITPAKVIRELKADLAAGWVLKPPPRTFLGVAPGRDAPELLGAPVGGVLPNSPAAAAGLRPGDLITHLDAAPVEGWSGLVRNIVGHKPGDKVKVTVKRGGAVQDFEVTLGQSND